jgi:hypothetical protein
MPLEDSSERVYVIYTSSVIEIRRRMSQATKAELKAVFDKLGTLVDGGTLFFPQQVYGELEQGNENLGGADDAPFEWIHAHRGQAVQDTKLFAHVRRVLEVALNLVDKDKTSGPDEADPWVVALALSFLEDGRAVTVITEDRNDRLDKTSVQSACGLLGIPAMSIVAFLQYKGFWSGR